MTSLLPVSANPATRLRRRLDSGELLRVPGCFDALSARILEEAGFEAVFLGGFSVAAARLGLPDVGLLGQAEMQSQAEAVCAATSLPVFGDADTGYGNAMNAWRTLLGFSRAGLACVMIEDQRWPKRCGHTAGKQVVARREAVARVRACVRAREEHGLDVLVMARTDACATHGLEEALWRARAFADEGADITFVEALEDPHQMERYCREVPGHRTVNLVEDGRTPWLPRERLAALGFSLVVHPVSLLLRAIHAMRGAARELAEQGETAEGARVGFDEARSLLGWPDYEERLRDLEAAEEPEARTATEGRRWE